MDSSEPLRLNTEQFVTIRLQPAPTILREGNPGVLRYGITSEARYATLTMTGRIQAAWAWRTNPMSTKINGFSTVPSTRTAGGRRPREPSSRRVHALGTVDRAAGRHHRAAVGRKSILADKGGLNLTDAEPLRRAARRSESPLGSIRRPSDSDTSGRSGRRNQSRQITTLLEIPRHNRGRGLLLIAQKHLASELWRIGQQDIIQIKYDGFIGICLKKYEPIRKMLRVQIRHGYLHMNPGIGLRIEREIVR